jgi:hypothetical protein
MNINYRSANLPPHCGNCRHLLWDDEACRCENTAMITDDEIKEAIAQVKEAGGTAEVVAEIARDEYHDRADIANYSDVCDPWGAKLPYDMAATPLVNRQRAADLEAADWQAFVDRVEKIMEAGK